MLLPHLGYVSSGAGFRRMSGQVVIEDIAACLEGSPIRTLG